MILFKNKKVAIKVFILIVIGVFYFGLPALIPTTFASKNITSAEVMNQGADQKLDGWGPDIANWIIIKALQLMQSVSGFVLGLGMSLVDLTLSDKMYEQVFFAGSSVEAINTGWGLVRDFVNMFFILILIFVAIATILRVNKFSDKKFIVYVVSAALFVNFSKPITMFIIDISNLAMSFFMSNIREGNASYSSALLNAQGLGEIFKSDTQSAETMGMLVAWIVEIVFKFIMGVMLLLLGFSLIVRLIALWVLIILSPLAFFAMALPGTAIASIKGTWVNKLTYWCFYGPVMLFFFWLALVLVSAIGLNVAFGDAELQMAGINKNHFIIGALKIIIPYASCIYMLFYGFDLSKKMASQAGQGASWGLGKSTAMFAGGALAAKYAGRGIAKGANMATGGIAPVAVSNVKESFKRNRQAGALQKKAFVPGGALDNNVHKSNLVNEATKQWDQKGTPSDKELLNIMNKKPSLVGKTIGNAAGVTGTRAEAEAKRKAAAIKLAEKGKLDKDGYGKAMSLLSNDSGNLEKFEKAAKKRNRKEFIEYGIDKNLDKGVEDAIVNEETRMGTTMSADDKTAFKAKSKEKIRKEAYESELKKMNLSEIMEQSPEFLEQGEVKNYLRKSTGEGVEKRFSVKQMRKQAAENLDGKKQKILADERFFEESKPDLSPDSAEDERDALRNMNG